MAYKEIKVSWGMVDQATREGKTLTQKLEELDPSTNYSGDLGRLDAFERQLLNHGIFPHSDPEAGIQASKIDAFFQAPDPTLKSLFPEFVDRVIREAKMKDSILSYLIATTKTINNNSYRSTYIDDSKIAQSKRRVGIGTPLPKVTLKMREQTNTIYKYGLAIEAPYETIRWMDLDEFALFIRREVKQAALDEAEGAIDTLLNGDGNANTAAKSTTIATLKGTAGKLEYKPWLVWAAKFRPYQLTTVVGGELEIVDFLTMEFPNVDPMKIVSLLKADRATRIEVRMAPKVYDDLLLVLTDHKDLSGKSKLLCIDKDFALQRLVEAGSNISENARYIENQTQLLTISENSGFSSIFADAARVLNYGA